MCAGRPDSSVATWRRVTCLCAQHSVHSAQLRDASLSACAGDVVLVCLSLLLLLVMPELAVLALHKNLSWMKRDMNR